MSVVHAIVWFGYHLWNPTILSVIRAIVWLGYHLWNPMATHSWHGSLEVLRDMATPNSTAALLRSVIATLAAAYVIHRIKRHQERKRMLRH